MVRRRPKRRKRRQKGGIFMGALQLAKNPAIQKYLRSKIANAKFKQKGGTYIPGTGMFDMLSRSGRSRARHSGMRNLKKDSDFIGQLFQAYVFPKLRKK